MTLSPYQLEVVNCTAPLILVASGPAVGKTAVIVARIQRLIRDGVPPERIAAISFTNSAADLLQARLGSVRLGACSTLHSFLLSLIRKHHMLIGYRSSNIAALSEEEATKLLKDTMSLMKVRATSDEMTQAVLNAAVIVPMARIETCARKYLDEIRDMESLSFDGILAYGRVVANIADPGFDHILIDEVQDSTDCDMEIYLNLRIPNKVFVGDWDQSIFSFRGGNALNILKIAQREDVTVLKLEENYRSLPNICMVAQRLIDHDAFRIPKVILPVRNHEENRGRVYANRFATGDDEYRWLVNAFNFNLPHPSLAFHDRAIICRTNVIVNEIRDRFEALGIPVEKPKRQELPSDWSKALLCVNLCANPNNDHLAKKWLLSEGYGESGVSKVEILAASSGQSVAQCEGLVFGEVSPKAFADQWRWKISPESRELIGCILHSKQPDDLTQLAWLMAQHTADQTETVPGFFVGTCHSAKGREFGTVFVAGFDDAIIPAKRDVAEERRIAFVALTRAKDCCIFTSSKKRKSSYNGEIIESEPSRFLNEMGLL